MNNSIKKYLKDLKIIKSNLNKFYYYHCSEWFRPDIKRFLETLDNEIDFFQKIIEKNMEKQKNQTTIYDFLKGDDFDARLSNSR